MDYTNKRVKIINIEGFEDFNSANKYIGQYGTIIRDYGDSQIYRFVIDFDDVNLRLIDESNGRFNLSLSNIEFKDDKISEEVLIDQLNKLDQKYKIKEVELQIEYYKEKQEIIDQLLKIKQDRIKELNNIKC